MKRKEREKEMKWKAEERARKAAEKAKRDAEKAKRVEERAAEKARKTVEKAANKAPGVSSRRKGQSTSKGTSESPAGPSEQEEPKLKAPRLVDEDIDTEECCACFGHYSDDIGTGREWLECACGRWLHEECVENIVYDANGKEK